MESKKDLSIKTVPVEIRVLTVDGKRMTKSVFNQITNNINGRGIVAFGDKLDTFTVLVDIVGWVYSGIDGDMSGQHKHLIYAANGILYKVWEADLEVGLRNASFEVKDYQDTDGYLEKRFYPMQSLLSPENQIFISI